MAKGGCEMAAVWQMAWALGIGTVFFLALRWGLRKIFGRRLCSGSRSLT